MIGKKTVIVSAAVVVCCTMLYTVLFGLSYTRDSYVCHSCKSIGQGKALCIFGCPVVKTKIGITRSLTEKECRHAWDWYFANSFGLLFNRKKWSGPLNYPYAKEFDDQLKRKRDKMEVNHTGKYNKLP